MTNTRDLLTSFGTCGQLLRYLRRRARLSQRELSIAVGYTESHISRIESDERPIDRTSLLALFVPALHLETEPAAIERLIYLCTHRPAYGSGKGVRAQQPSAHASASAEHQHNLPAALTSFIGRSDELRDTICMLKTQQARLLTLTGFGGCGKTRLALRIGELLLPDYADGVWLVDLAAVTDPQMLPQVISAVIPACTQGGDITAAKFSESLQFRKMLLILDNCEHLIGAIAALVSRLMLTCANVRILATSREPLAVPGEHTYCVLPLPLPRSQLGMQPRAEEIAGFDAIQLFLERAQVGAYHFVFNDANAPAVAEICQRLDGIPLGIELAAAWINTLSPEEIRAQLAQDSALLVNSLRGTEPRHRTLQAVIDWSYNLLADNERRLLRWLAVFSGGWNLGALSAIAARFGSGRAIHEDIYTERGVLELLGALISKSLVAVEHTSPTQSRFRLLEPLREYLLQELAASGDAELVRNCHLDYYAAYAQDMGASLHRERSRDAHAHLAQDAENFRTALRWSLARGRIAHGVRLAVSLARYWRQRGDYHEACRWLRDLAARAQSAPDTPPTALRQLLLWLCTFERLQGNMGVARELGELTLALSRENGDQIGTAVALENLGWCYTHVDRTRATELFVQSHEAFQTAGCTRQCGRLLTTLAQMEREDGNVQRASSHLEAAISIARSIDDLQGAAHAMNGLAELASFDGDYERAHTLLDESLVLSETAGAAQDDAWVHCALAENCWHRKDSHGSIQHGIRSWRRFAELGSKFGQAVALHHVGLANLTRGELDAAEHHLEVCLQLCYDTRSDFLAGRCLATIGAIMIRKGNAVKAVEMLSTAMTILEANRHLLAPADRAFYERLIADSRSGVNDETFAAAWVKGSHTDVWGYRRMHEIGCPSNSVS